MFERYTERARRVIFYARYEASQYGSPYIETEHLLLGLLREDCATVNVLVPGQLSEEWVRKRVVSEITIRERISTSIEVPLTKASKRVLNLAAEEAEKCGHRHIGTEHLLLGLLCVEEGLAYRILHEQKLDLAKLEDRVRHLPAQTLPSLGTIISSWKGMARHVKPFAGPEEFLQDLRAGNWQGLKNSLAEGAVFVSADGKRWSGRDEISRNLEPLLAPFITKNAKFHVEGGSIQHIMFWVGTILWDHIHLQANAEPGRARMTLAFASDPVRWSLSLVQITAVAEPEALGKTVAS